MGEQHRLGALEMGVPGQVHIARLDGAIEQDDLQVGHGAGDVDELALRPQPQVGGHLIVAAARGVQLGAGRTGELGHPPLDRGVDVLVARQIAELVPGDLVVHLFEGGEHFFALAVADEPARARPRTCTREPAMSSRHSRRSNGRLTVYAISASAGPPSNRPCQSVVVAPSGHAAGRSGHRR